MRILILQPGIGSYRVDFFNALAERVTLKIIYFYEHSSGQTFDRDPADELAGCEIGKLEGGFNLRSYYPIRPKLAAAIEAFDPDIVVSHEYNTISMQVWLAWLKSGKKWKFFIWTSDTAWMAEQCRGLRKMARDFMCRRADAVMVYSEPVVAAYARFANLAPEKVTVCSNVQSGQRLRRNAAAALPEAHELYRQLELAGKKVFLFVGRLHPVKNLPTLFRAFAKAAPPEAVLLVVGGGELERELEALRTELAMRGRIILCGRAEGVGLAAYYDLAGTLVLPSFSETFGAVVNEALAIGVRAVLTAKAGAAVLIASERQGQLIDPCDQKSLEIALKIEAEQMVPAAPSVRPSLLARDLPECVNAFLNFCERSLRRE